MPAFPFLDVKLAGAISPLQRRNTESLLEGQIAKAKPVEIAALKQTLTDLKTSDPETSVVVRGASDVDYQRVIIVLDLLQQTDITKVGLATETGQ